MTPKQNHSIVNPMKIDKDKRISQLEEELDALETAAELMSPDQFPEIMAMKLELMEEFDTEDELYT